MSASLIAETGSLRAQDYLCPEMALEQNIDRLEKQAATIAISLRNKREELARRKARESRLIAEGKLRKLSEM